MEPVAFGMAGFSLMSGMGRIGLTTSATATAVTTAAAATTVAATATAAAATTAAAAATVSMPHCGCRGRRGRRSCGPGRFGKGTAG